MDTTYIVVDQDLNIVNIYACSEECKYPDHLTQIPISNTSNALHFSAVRNDDGTIGLIEDPVKVENWRQSRFRVLRDTRNTLLTKCDWTQVPDSQLTDEQKLAWRQYRQQLRDIPINTVDPDTVVWPTPPQ